MSLWQELTERALGAYCHLLTHALQQAAGERRKEVGSRRSAPAAQEKTGRAAERNAQPNARSMHI